MTPEQFQRTEDLYFKALKLAREERAGFLDASCSDDGELRDEVAHLLAQPEVDLALKPAKQGSTSEVEADGKLETALPGGDRIAGYRIDRKIGEGGMGEVYEAQQERPVRRRVALKVIKLGMGTRAVVARFEAERQALALMDHPHIAKVFDAGATEKGRPYFAMGYVDGVSVTEFCDTQRLSTSERLDLFVQICQAIQHAHQKGIIHRDIKPSNVLVAVHDQKPVPKVIDFGVAKAIDQRLTEKTVFTAQGQLIGTPDHMSPEQAGMPGQDIDSRSDIYSLGVLLYELLVGTSPYGPTYLRDRGTAGILQVIREEEPRKPSTRLSSLGSESASFAERRRTSPRALRRQLRGDLDWITMKALEKDRDRRYAAVSEFADDVRRHLRHEPVVAGPPSTAYRARKFVRRNRGFVTAATAFVLLLTGSLIGMSGLYVRSESARRESESARREALRSSYVANIVAAGSALTAHEITRVRRSLEVVPREFHNWEWHYLNAAADTSLRVLRGHTARVDGAAFSSDGRFLASAAQDHQVHIWNLNTGEAEVTLSGHEGAVYNAVFSPDDKRVATASHDGTVRIWDSKTGTQLAELRHDGVVWLVAYSPDGSRLASASSDRSVRIWDASTGELLHSLRGHKGIVFSVTFSPDGERVASATGVPDNAVYLWNTFSGQRLTVLKGHQDDVSSIAFNPDSTLLASGSKDNSVRLWNPATGELIRTLSGHKDDVSSVAFNSDGTRLASASWDKTIRLWDPATGKELAVLLGHGGYVMSVTFGAGDTLLASASWDQTVRIWDARRAEQRDLLRRLEPGLYVLAVSADGSRLVSGCRDGTIRIRTAHANENLVILRGHGGAVVSVSFSPAQPQFLVSASVDRTARIWNLPAGTSRVIWKGEDDPAHTVMFSPDGRHLALATESGDIRILDSAAGDELGILSGNGAGMVSLAFCPNGVRLAAAYADKTVGVWNLAARERTVALPAHDESMYAIVFSPDGRHLAGASKEGNVLVWDSRSGKLERILSGHEHEVRCVAYSSDGTRLASGSNDGTVRVWDPSTGDELVVLRGHEAIVRSVRFSPYPGHVDRARLFSASEDGVVRVWDTVPHRTQYLGRQPSAAAAETEPIRPAGTE